MQLFNLLSYITRFSIGLIVLLTLLVGGCGGSAGGGGSNVNSTPSISNLSISPNAAYVNTGTISVIGSLVVSDTGGDLATATIEILNSLGTIVDTTVVTIQNSQGFTQGAVSLASTVDTNTIATDNYTVRIYLTDAGGRNSNTLTTTFIISKFPWVARTAMPTTRSGFAVANLNGLIYVCGGMLSNTGVTPGPETAVVEIFDTATQTWSTGSPMPTARIGASATVMGGKLYVIGGYNLTSPGGLGIIEQFDPATNIWTQMASMPTVRSFASAVTIEPNIFVVGGSGGGFDLAAIEAYDATNTWVTFPPMTTPRSHLSAENVNGALYATGGIYALSLPTNFMSVVEVFDPLTSLWSSQVPMIAPRQNHAAVWVNGMLYVMGGSNVNRSINSIEAFNPATNTWISKTPLPSSPLLDGIGVTNPSDAAAVVNGKVYLFGASALFEYTPADDIQ